MQKLNNNNLKLKRKGITLIALVITIMVTQYLIGSKNVIAFCIKQKYKKQ